MKIIFITSDFYPRIGGGENYILNLAKEFSIENDVHVFCPNELDNGTRNIFNFKVHYLPFYTLLGNKFIKPLLIYKYAKKINPDIIYSSGPSIMDFFAVFSSKILRKKIVITYHADLDLSKLTSRFFTIVYFLFCLPRYCKIIVTTNRYKSILLNRGIKTEKIFVVPVGFENRNKDYDFDKVIEKKIQLLFVGGLDSQHLYKNSEILIKSMACLDKNKFKLNIIGEGELKARYQNLAKNLNLSNVKFLGSVNDQELIDQYKKANILILPSNSEKEGFGIVLLEALSFGCKIIAGSKCGGAFLIEENVEFGALYDGTVSDLYNKINNIVLNHFDIYKMDKFLKKYEWSEISKEILDIINKSS